MPTVDLLQRGAELAALTEALDALSGGDGALVLLDGPAGIGKTALLRTARALAVERGWRVCTAVASELDRAFAYGLVHQLLEGEVLGSGEERRARLTGGAAAHAEAVFDLSQEPGQDPGHAVLHGLYWLCANLADEGPLCLFVDDLHWGDRASLRFLEYLGRRLDGVPLLVVATTRSGEPGADAELLGQLAAVAGPRHLQPGPLDEVGTAALLARWLEVEPAAQFTEAVVAVTGGNPLLVESTAREAAQRGLRGVADETPQLEDLTGSTVVAGVQRRLRTLGGDAKLVAEAASVLGGRRTVDDLASVVQLDARQVRAALDTLAAASMLRPASLEFTHSLVRAAVARGAAPAALADLHARAAARLRDAGARADELAVHLLAVPPAADPAVVDALRRAAEQAAAGGAIESAIPLLRRALEEPATPAARPGLLLELGELEQRAGDPAGFDRLGAALGEGLTGDLAARAHRARAARLMASNPVAALEELDTALAVADDADLVLRLEAGLLDVTAYLASLADRREALLAAGRADPAASPAMLAHLAQDAASRGGAADETLALVHRALADGRMMGVIGPTSPTFHLLILTLRHCEQPELAAQLLAEGDAIVERTGSFMGALYANHARAFWHLMFGSVAAAEAFARSALSAAEQGEVVLAAQGSQIVLAELLLELDRTDEAARLIDAVPESPALDETIIGTDLLSVRGLVRAEQGRRAEAEADLRRAIDQLRRRGWRAPLKSRARLRLATLVDDRDEALELVEHAVAAAREAGTPGALCASLRVLARVRGGADAIPLLQEAEAVAATSPMRLERGWAQHDLGRMLRVEGARVDAREPLGRALELAQACEAPRLARAVREELAASGARPRSSELSGVASLTPSERRVADLAAAGRTNREIAEALWVTRKTVEVHLGKTYGKLGIRTRAELPEALGKAEA